MPHNYATELGSYLRQTSVSHAITTISIDVYIYIYQSDVRKRSK